MVLAAADAEELPAAAEAIGFDKEAWAFVGVMGSSSRMEQPLAAVSMSKIGG